jgi:hypothetical protein
MYSSIALPLPHRKDALAFMAVLALGALLALPSPAAAAVCSGAACAVANSGLAPDFVQKACISRDDYVGAVKSDWKKRGIAAAGFQIASSTYASWQHAHCAGGFATSSPAADSYALDDVRSVAVRHVDPSASVADDEYAIYTVTLKDRTVYRVTVFDRGTLAARDQAFRDTGYAGDVDDLIAMASDTPPTRSTPIPKQRTASSSTEVNLNLAHGNSASSTSFVITMRDGSTRTINISGLTFSSSVLTGILNVLSRYDFITHVSATSTPE